MAIDTPLSMYVVYVKGDGGQGRHLDRGEDTKHADWDCKQVGQQKYGDVELSVQVSFDDKTDVFARHSRNLLVREFGSDSGCRKVGIGRVVGVEQRGKCVIGA